MKQEQKSKQILVNLIEMNKSFKMTPKAETAEKKE